MAIAIVALALVPLAWAGVFPHHGAAPTPRRVTCGVERWAVKTLTDPAASKVNMTPKPTTVAALRRLTAPANPDGPRIRGVETTTYRVRATLVEMKLEKDSDIHLVIADPRNARATMIVEFPDAGCTVGAAPLARAKMQRAKSALVASCGAATRSFRRLGGTATISGVGFFDVIHGQAGVAPNGIELHPVLGVTHAICGSPAPPGPPPGPPPGRKCAASYPTVCIPPPPPDLNCSDIKYRNFRVRWDVPNPDPHHFDGNRNGIGCET